MGIKIPKPEDLPVEDCTDWFENPVTESIFNELKEKRHALMNDWMGDLLCDTQVEKITKLEQRSARIEAIDWFLDMEIMVKEKK